MFDCLDITAQTVGVEEVPSFVYLSQMPFQLPVSGYLSCRSNLTSIDRELSKIVLTKYGLTDNCTGESLNNPALLNWLFLDRLTYALQPVRQMNLKKFTKNQNMYMIFAKILSNKTTVQFRTCSKAPRLRTWIFKTC